MRRFPLSPDAGLQAKSLNCRQGSGMVQPSGTTNLCRINGVKTTQSGFYCKAGSVHRVSGVGGWLLAWVEPGSRTERRGKPKLSFL
jgi:hypothetical protein